MRVTIAGAGVVGCAIACELARRGAAVRVVDPRGIGQGATQASAGILAPAIEGHSDALLRLLRCSMTLYDAFVSRLAAETGAPVEYACSGTLQVALDELEAAALARASARLTSLGVAHDLFGAGDTAGAEAALSSRATAGLLVPGDGYVVVGSLVAGLTEAARVLGVEFVTDRVESVRGGDGGAQVITTRGALESDAAIVAAGSWQSQVVGHGLRPAPVRPIRGQIVRLRPAEPVASRVVWGRRCYVVPWRDGSVLVGATVEDVGFDERTTVAGIRGLLAAAAELLPVLDGAAFEEARVGLRPMAADELPVIGASTREPRVFHATGHYRNGVLLAPLTAALVADLVLEGRERDELTLTRPARFGL